MGSRLRGKDTTRPQCRLGGCARGGAVEQLIVAVLRSARRDFQIDEHRPLFGQHGADLLFEYLQVGERMDAAISRRAREAGKIDPAAAWDRMPAVRLVGPVFAHEVDEIARGGDRKSTRL